MAGLKRLQEGRRAVKYVVLIYSNPATWGALPAAESDRVIKVHNDLIEELTR